MAPVYDFRHVELDKIGRGKRIVKPPGGECSNIFGGETCTDSATTPTRKMNNYMQSTIFSPGHHHNGNGTTPTSPSPSKGGLLDTQERLFGGSPDPESPRKIVNRQRSSIFEEETVDSRAVKSTPVRRPQINPITGAPLHENGTPNGFYSNGSTPNGGTPNGSTPNGGTPNGGTPNGGTPNGGTPNGGTPNGHFHNGHSNGYSTPESPMNGSHRVRNPPGGKSSGIF